MAPAQKRKASPGLDDADDEPAKKRLAENADAPGAPTDDDAQTDTPAQQKAQAERLNTEDPSTEVVIPAECTPALEEASASTSTASTKMADRMARFAALKARGVEARKANFKEAAAEAKRMNQDPSILTSLARKRDIAAHKLLKAETAEEGEDFERKRAWDWTIEESEKWDRRMEKKEKHREDTAFQDYRQQARKDYKRQLRQMQGKDQKALMDEYEKQKNEAIQRAVARGGMEIVETEDGELIAVDKDGSFYSTADSTDFLNHKPTKEALDRLVGEMKKAEESRMKKRKARGQDDESGDVTYINAKNKQFNDKLARFYNKYTGDIRESFDRGTAL